MLFGAAVHAIRALLGLAVAAAILVPVSAVAQPVSGACSALDLSRYVVDPATGSLDADGFRAVVVNDRLPVYAQPAGGAAIMRSSDLRFRDPVRIRQITGLDGGASRMSTRVRIEEIGTQNEIGWVDASGLLCRDKPLQTSEALERRAFIKTADAKANTMATVTAYPRPVGTECDGRCTELGAFRLYFVFSEEADRLLLGEFYNIEYGEGLVGWVAKTDPVTKSPLVIPWLTGIGLRPREDLTWTGPDGKTEEGTVCAFPEREQAVAHKVSGAETGCRPILGGPDWFALPMRMALLNTRDGIHEVAMHAVGFGPGHQPQGAKAMVDPKQTLEQSRRTDDLTRKLGEFKRADVFFLVDGTDSMRNTLDTIKGRPGQPGAVDSIVSQLRNQLLVGSRLRYGFRVYGDTSQHPANPYGTTGLGEGLPLSGACDDETPSNDKQFKEAFANIRVRDVVTAEPLEDYAENVYGGIEQALIDMATCKDNLKFLFVIGDNGYNPTKQLERRFRAIGIGDLIDQARARYSKLKVFFVQPPRDPEIAGKADYQRAYRLFTTQAEDFLRQFYRGESFDPRMGFIAMERNGQMAIRYEELAKALSEQVVSVATPEGIDKVGVNIRSGQSVRKAVSQAKAAYPSVPGWFWDIVSKETCQVLGAQCEQDMFQAVPIFYIAQSPYRKTAPDLVPEIWLPQEQLSLWMNFLTVFQERERGDEARKRLVANLVKGIDAVMKIAQSDTGESFQKYYSRVGYFKEALETPLMRYAPDELLNPDLVKPCEFERLRQWALQSRDLLQMTQVAGQRPKYVAEFGSAECPLSERGQKIPYLRNPAQSVALAPGVPGAAFGHSTKGGMVYWIPREFMP